MSRVLAADALDAILALQFTVAWAGEAAGDPARLGWWKSDLVDPEGGGDLFARLAPKTAPWASLGLAREVARRVDQAARDKLAQADSVWTLFHFGFAVDEQLFDRIAHHRQHQHVPADVLGALFIVGKPWSKDTFASILSTLGKPKVELTPAGRKLLAQAASAPEAARLLAAALLPLSSCYPLPFLEVAAR
jgi:hypothetical protein